MTKNMKGTVTVLLLAGLAYGSYKLLVKGKKDQAKWLMKSNYSGGTVDDLIALGDDFIKAWYKAAKAGQQSFVLGGNNYNTQGGKKV